MNVVLNGGVNKSSAYSRLRMSMSKITSLIISPHVDDEILGCGGILNEECFVYYCGINESKWNEETKTDDVEHRVSVDERFKELQSVASLLGFEYECNFDSHVNVFSEQEFVPIFEQLVNRLKPERIFLPYAGGYNQDHRAVFNAAFIALRPHDKNFFVKKIFAYEAVHDVLWSHESMELNYFVPIDIERKIKAYELHKSQVRSFRSPDMLRRIAKLRGDMSGCEYAEAFRILRWVDSGSLSKRETSQVTTALDNRTSTNQRFGDKDLEEWLIEKLSPRKGEHILDVGCGTGSQLIKLAKFTETDYSCVGLDISESSITQAAKKAGESGVKVKLVIESMDRIEETGLEDGSFDTICSTYSIYYAADVKRVLETLKKKTKPTGRIAITTPYRDNNQGWFDFLKQFMKLPVNVERSSSTFMEEEIIPFAHQYFSNVTTFEFVNNISIPTYEDLRRYWVSNIYYKEELDPGFEKYAKEHFMENDSFGFFKKALLVIMEGPKPLTD